MLRPVQEEELNVGGKTKLVRSLRMERNGYYVVYLQPLPVRHSKCVHTERRVRSHHVEPGLTPSSARLTIAA